MTRAIIAEFVVLIGILLPFLLTVSQVTNFSAVFNINNYFKFKYQQIQTN